LPDKSVRVRHSQSSLFARVARLGVPSLHTACAIERTQGDEAPVTSTSLGLSKTVRFDRTGTPYAGPDTTKMRVIEP